jgi:hypothetical protein
MLTSEVPASIHPTGSSIFENVGTKWLNSCFEPGKDCDLSADSNMELMNLEHEIREYSWRRRFEATGRRHRLTDLWRRVRAWWHHDSRLL